MFKIKQLIKDADRERYENTLLKSKGNTNSLLSSGKNDTVETIYNIPVTPNAIPGKATIWSVQSPDGGSGVTTVATNLAAHLAITSPNRVVIIDLDGIGAVRGRMGYTIKDCIVNILDWQNVQGPKDMHRAMLEHSSGVIVIPGVVHYDQVPLVTPGLIFSILTILKERFDHIVLDCPSVGCHMVTWAATLVSDVVLTVIKPDRTCIDFLRDNISFLNRLGCKDRTHIVVNHWGMEYQLDIFRIPYSELGSTISYTLPYSSEVIRCNNQRELIVRKKPKDPFSLALKELVENMEWGELG